MRAGHKLKHRCTACGRSHLVLAGAPAEATATARLVAGASVGALVATAAVLALALQEETQPNHSDRDSAAFQLSYPQSTSCHVTRMAAMTACSCKTARIIVHGVAAGLGESTQMASECVAMAASQPAATPTQHGRHAAHLVAAHAALAALAIAT